MSDDEDYYDANDGFYDEEEPPLASNSLQSSPEVSIMETSRNHEPTHGKIEKMRIGRLDDKSVPYKMFENRKLVDTNTSSIESLQISPLNKYIYSYKNFIIKLVCENYENYISNICPASVWKNLIKRIIIEIKIILNSPKSFFKNDKKETILVCYREALNSLDITKKHINKSLFVFGVKAENLFSRFENISFFLNYCHIIYDNTENELKLVCLILFFYFLQNLKKSSLNILTKGGRKSKRSIRKQYRTKKIKRANARNFGRFFKLFKKS